MHKIELRARDMAFEDYLSRHEGDIEAALEYEERAWRHYEVAAMDEHDEFGHLGEGDAAGGDIEEPGGLLPAGRDTFRRLGQPERYAPAAAAAAPTGDPPPDFKVRHSHTIAMRVNPPVLVGTGKRGPKVVTNPDVGRHLDEHHAGRFGGPSDYRDTKAFRHAVNAGSEELRYQLAQTEGDAHWYDDDIGKALGQTQKHFPSLKDPHHRTLFLQMAALTSPRTNPIDNWKAASIIYGHWLKTGEMLRKRPNGAHWDADAGKNIIAHMALLEHMLNHHQTEKDPLGVRGYANFALHPQDPREMDAHRAAVGIGGFDRAGRDVHHGATMYGPKVGPFFLNLNGLADTTVDVWHTRAFNKHFGQVLGPDGVVKDVPDNVEHRQAIERWTEEIAKKHKITPQQAQAILWFHEQHLYNRLGIKDAIPRTYSEGAQALGPPPQKTKKQQPGSPRRYAQGEPGALPDEEPFMLPDSEPSGEIADELPDEPAGEATAQGGEVDPWLRQLADSMDEQGLPEGHPDLREPFDEEPPEPGDPLHAVAHMTPETARAFSEAMRLREQSAGGAWGEQFAQADQEDDEELREAFRESYGFEADPEQLEEFRQRREATGGEELGDITGDPEDQDNPETLP